MYKPEYVHANPTQIIEQQQQSRIYHQFYIFIYKYIMKPFYKFSLQ